MDKHNSSPDDCTELQWSGDPQQVQAVQPALPGAGHGRSQQGINIIEKSSSSKTVKKFTAVFPLCRNHNKILKPFGQFCITTTHHIAEFDTNQTHFRFATSFCWSAWSHFCLIRCQYHKQFLLAHYPTEKLDRLPAYQRKKTKITCFVQTFFLMHRGLNSE